MHSRQTISTQFLRFGLSTALAGIVVTAGAFAQSAPGPQSNGFASIPGLPAQDHSQGTSPPPPGIAPRFDDPNLQQRSGPTQTDGAGALDSIVVDKDFAGPQNSGSYPANPAIATGPNHVLTAVSSAIEIYKKDGTRILKTTAATFFKSLNNLNTMALSQPSATFDLKAKRFVLVFGANQTAGVKRSRCYIAISKDADPNRGWYLWSTNMRTNSGAFVNHYVQQPRVSTDGKAIYIVSNMHSTITNNFVYSKIRVIQNKAQLLTGHNTVDYTDKWGLYFNGTLTFAPNIIPVKGLLDPYPVHRAYFLAAAPGNGSNLYLWTLGDVLNTTTGPTIKSGKVAVSSYTPFVDLPQKGGIATIDNQTPALANAVRRFSKIWTVHSVQYGIGINKRAALRWYEIDLKFWPSAGTPTIKQSNNFASVTRHYSFPAISVNSREDVAIVFCSSSKTQYMSVRLTGRRKSDAANSLQNSTALKSGEAYYNRQFSGVNRWGPQMAADTGPNGDIFLIGQYSKPAHTWGTWVASVFPQPLVSPIGYADKEGENVAYGFGGRPSARIQLVDTNYSNGIPRAITEFSTRLDEVAQAAEGREWNLVVKMTESDRFNLSHQFANNHVDNTATVFSGTMKLPSLNGAPAFKPDRFQRFVVPFSQQWVFSGQNDRTITSDFSFSGGTLNNGAPWTSNKAYKFDAAPGTSWATSTSDFWGVSCQDSNLAVDAYLNPMLRTYAKESGSASTSDMVRVSLSGVTKKSSTALYAYGLKGFNPGLGIGACNDLYIDPLAILGVPTNASGAHILNLGYVPYQPAYAGVTLFAQAGWADSVTGQLKLSRAGFAKVPVQPATPTLFAITANSHLSPGNTTPGASPYYNVIRQYRQ